MKRLPKLCLLVLLLALPACQMKPVENIEAAPTRAPEGATLEQVKKGIITGGQWREWDIRELAPGYLVAETLVRGKHRAVVDILYDTKVFSIRYKDIENLNYNGRSIHKAYEEWIDDLRISIQQQVSLIKVDRLPDSSLPKNESASDLDL